LSSLKFHCTVLLCMQSNVRESLPIRTLGMGIDTCIDRRPVIRWTRRKVVVVTIINGECDLLFQIFSSEQRIKGMGDTLRIIADALLIIRMSVNLGFRVERCITHIIGKQWSNGIRWGSRSPF